LARQQRPHVDAVRRQVVDRPVEFDAPAEGAAQIELLRHQVVDDEGQRFGRQRAHLHDGAAALDCGNARFQRDKAARHFVRNVEPRPRQRFGIAACVQRHVGAHELRLRQRAIEDVADRNACRACEARREHGQAADGAGPGDQDRFAK